MEIFNLVPDFNGTSVKISSLSIMFAVGFFFFLIFFGVELLYNIVLVSTVQQSESAIYIHISPLFWISFAFRSPESTE